MTCINIFRWQGCDQPAAKPDKNVRLSLRRAAINNVCEIHLTLGHLWLCARCSLGLQLLNLNTTSNQPACSPARTLTSIDDEFFIGGAYDMPHAEMIFNIPVLDIKNLDYRWQDRILDIKTDRYRPISCTVFSRYQPRPPVQWHDTWPYIRWKLFNLRESRGSS